MGALVERIEAMEDEASRLAALLGRTEDRLASRSGSAPGSTPDREPGRSSDANGAEGESEEHPPVAVEQVRTLVAVMAGAGASRPEIAAWVFRELGVVVSDRVIEDVILTQGRATQPT